MERGANITICEYCSSRVKITYDPAENPESPGIEPVHLVTQQTILDNLLKEYHSLEIEQQALDRKISNFHEIIASTSQEKKNFWGKPQKISQSDLRYIEDIQKQVALAEQRLAWLENQMGQLRTEIGLRQDQARR